MFKKESVLLIDSLRNEKLSIAVINVEGVKNKSHKLRGLVARNWI